MSQGSYVRSLCYYIILSFGTELRKVAKAIIKQPILESRLAALVAIHKSIPPGNAWSQFLVSHHDKEEMDIATKWWACRQE